MNVEDILKCSWLINGWGRGEGRKKASGNLSVYFDDCIKRDDILVSSYTFRKASTTDNQFLDWYL